MSSRSQVFAPTSSQIERAWYLLTVLLRLDRPASPAELSSRSALDPIFLSPDLVEFLCQIPGSPISLTRGGLIVGSEVAVAAFRQFLDLTPGSFVPRVLSRFSEERRGWNSIKLMYARKRKERSLEAGLMGPSAKRRLLWSSDGAETKRDDQLGIQSSDDKALKVHIDVADAFTNSLSAVFSTCVLSQGIALIPSLRNINVLSEGLAVKPSISNVNSLLSSFEIENDVHLRRDGLSETMCGTSHSMILGQESHDDQPIVVQKEMCDNTQAITVHKVLELFGSNGSLDSGQNAIISDPVNTGRLKMREPDIGSTLADKAKDKPLFCMGTLGEDSCIVQAAPLAIGYEVNPVSSIFLGAENGSNEPSVKLGSLHVQTSRHPKNEVDTNVNYCETEGISFQTDAYRRHQDRSVFTAEPGTILEQQRMSFERPKIMDGVASHEGFQRSFREPNSGRNDNSPKCEQDIRNKKGALAKQKMRSRIPNAPLKENKQETTPMISKINSESKLLPNFESFVIVEEEGSGGYGTVYRVRRKEDGKIFAVKYPHPNAHSHHVNNELKMLERFGGRNFVIKYEGSFKKGQSECFVLEHVDHDRPEVLKKEIDVFEVQWYGYCMFRALASLHKHGIVHRDVKPGNFLFSRKLNKGYLIDFNLASDLYQKFSKSSKSVNKSNADLDVFSLPITKSTSYNQAGIGRKNRVLDNIRKDVAKDSRRVLFKNMKKGSSKVQIETFPNIESTKKYGSQAADSGVTSAKDPTSTRTHSADMLKQPIIPYKGRKELINFVNEAMQSPNHMEVTGPASQRKRVAAPLGKMDNNRLMIPTPMPLHSGGNAVAGAGMFNRGNRKHKREGPCVGTKGFRAPEVLFKSCHQGCKVDVWSAGVTLLYLIIGKAPFGGDPEQNIKEIAKLRGSEDLWEVAKLHNCESSYPQDLLDVQFLPTMKLRDWCLKNTKRPEFLELVPDSLFDLLDKCLTVNPRCRITAEEALMHRFFGPCHESLRKQRLLRRATSSEPEKLPLC